MVIIRVKMEVKMANTRRKLSFLHTVVALSALLPSGCYGMRARLFKGILTAGTVANIYLANSEVAHKIKNSVSGYFFDPHKKLEDVPDDVKHWAQEQLLDREKCCDEVKNASSIKLKIAADDSWYNMAATQTINDRYILFSKDTVKEIRKSLNDPQDSVKKCQLHLNSWFLDHEMGHLVNNDYLKVAYWPMVAIGTHVTGRCVAKSFISLFKLGTPKTIPALIGSLGLALTGGAMKHFVNTLIIARSICCSNERKADDFASHLSKDPETLKQTIRFFDWWTERKDKEFGRGDLPDWTVRLKYWASDKTHPTEPDRADSIRKVLKERFGPES